MTRQQFPMVHFERPSKATPLKMLQKDEDLVIPLRSFNKYLEDQSRPEKQEQNLISIAKQIIQTQQNRHHGGGFSHQRTQSRLVNKRAVIFDHMKQKYSEAEASSSNIKGLDSRSIFGILFSCSTMTQQKRLTLPKIDKS